MAKTMDPSFEPEEDERELSLRPKLLSEFLGQAAIKRNLEVFIRAARERGERFSRGWAGASFPDGWIVPQ